MRFFPGISTPSILGMSNSPQPCLCLWRGLVQITRTTPRRRTILHRSQIRLTELLTFIRYLHSEKSRVRYQPQLSLSTQNIPKLQP